MADTRSRMAIDLRMGVNGSSRMVPGRGQSFAPQNEGRSGVNPFGKGCSPHTRKFRPPLAGVRMRKSAWGPAGQDFLAARRHHEFESLPFFSAFCRSCEANLDSLRTEK
jgi:hypothetical protein